MKRYQLCRYGITTASIIAVVFVILMVALNPFGIVLPEVRLDIIVEIVTILGVICIAALASAFIYLLAHGGGEHIFVAVMILIFITAIYGALFAIGERNFTIIQQSIEQIIYLLAVIAVFLAFVAPLVHQYVSKPVCKRIYNGGDSDE